MEDDKPGLASTIYIILSGVTMLVGVILVGLGGLLAGAWLITHMQLLFK